MRVLLKKIAFPVLNFWYQKKTNKVTFYSNYGIRLKINPGVFHPGIFLSTNIFIRFLKTLNLKNKNILELGAGSGMISFFLANKQANVTASDINKNAIQGLKENIKTNNSTLKVITSNLFEKIDPNEFHIIIINPPYYPKKANNEKEQAFFCGENFDYFEQLFLQLKNLWTTESDIYMILSEDCEIANIKSIANKNNIELGVVFEEKKRKEWNYIFKLTK